MAYSSRVTCFILQTMGCGVLVLNFSSRRVKVKFSLYGFVCFLLWYTLYYYSVYKTLAEDKSILRVLYDTKLRNYGDLFEIAVSLFYSFFAIWKLPFALSGDSKRFQVLVDVDAAFQNVGAEVDYKQHTVNIAIGVFVQSITITIRATSIYGSLWNLDLPIPYQNIYVVLATDAAIACLITHFCLHLNALTVRLKLMNKVLSEIAHQEATDGKENTSNTPRCLPIDIQYNIICDKIKECSQIYNMLFKGINMTNEMFGYGILITLLITIAFIILNMFYFMEATAAGLFHDGPRYLSFFVYIFWAVMYYVGVMFLVVIFSDTTIEEAKNTSLVVHKIINVGIHPSVTEEAMLMSFQLLQNTPRINAGGVYNIDFALILDSVGFVTTFLVMLLQFAVE